MKKIAFMLAVILVVPSTGAYAREITILVNNNPLVSPIPAQIVNDRTMLPMRAIFERLGADVNWVEAERMIIATKDDLLIVMKIGEDSMTVQKTDSNELKIVKLDSPPFIENGSTLVPVRAVAESLGANVNWNAETYTVAVSVK